jgi:5-methylcytosine-specific restriction endonuclease McrA
MPMKPLGYCTHPGCPVRVASGACPQHAVRANYVVRRWYRTMRWIRLRYQVLVDAAYTCAQCGHVQTELEVDHIVKHDGDPVRFWNRHNLQALCPPCHARKTATGA